MNYGNIILSGTLHEEDHKLEDDSRL